MRQALFLLLAAVLIFSSPIVELKIKESAGVARINEPVLMGVPLPESLYTDTSVFALKDASGNVIPCDFRPAARWWRDKRSIRWLHLDFQTSVGAGEEKKVTLENDPASHAISASNLKVTNQTDKYVVETGLIKFSVKKKGFNLFDEVWVDESGAGNYDAAHQVVAPHAGGFSQLSASVRYYSRLDTNSTAVLERLNPMSCCIRINGSLKNASGTPLFVYTARLYAYNNSKMVKTMLTWEYHHASLNAAIPLNGLNLELPLVLSQKNFVMGARTAPKTGTLSAGQEAYLVVNGNDSYKYGGVIPLDSGNTRTTQSVDMSWMAAYDGTKGVAAGVKWFWQNYPSSMELSGDGLLNIGLFTHRYRSANSLVLNYPPRNLTFYTIYPGMAKTHEIRFVFFNDDSEAEMRSQAVGATGRLYALAPVTWYCRGARGFTDLTENGNSSLYLPTIWSIVNTSETAFRNAALKCLGNTLAATGGKDAYDYLAWGDNPHQYFGAGDMMWNGNYYDLPHVMWLNYARLGDARFVDYADAHTAHIYDLHMVHFGAGDYRDGACRYCPPTNHIGADALEPDVQGHTSHHKTQSLFEKYWFLGDDRALDAAKKGFNWVKAGGTAMSTNVWDGTTFWYARRPAHTLFTLTSMYKHTLLPADLATVVQHYNAIKPLLISDPDPGADFLIGLLTEALIDVYELTGDADVVNTIKIVNDKISGFSANSALAYAFLYRYYNSPVYYSKAVTALNSFGDGISFFHHERDYVEPGHSIPRAYYWLAIPDSAKNRTVGDEIFPAGDAVVTSVQVAPNPVNGSAWIRFPNQAKNASVAIYDVTGRLIRRWDRVPSEALSWNMAENAKGIYVIRVRSGGRTYRHKAVKMQ